MSTGRAVTTTTPSNQVRTSSPPNVRPAHPEPNATLRHQITTDLERRPPAGCPPERLYSKTRPYRPDADDRAQTTKSQRSDRQTVVNTSVEDEAVERFERKNASYRRSSSWQTNEETWSRSVESWYEGLNNYFIPNEAAKTLRGTSPMQYVGSEARSNRANVKGLHSFDRGRYVYDHPTVISADVVPSYKTPIECRPDCDVIDVLQEEGKYIKGSIRQCTTTDHNQSENKFKNKLKKNLSVPMISTINPKYLRSTTIGNIQEENIARNRIFGEILNVPKCDAAGGDDENHDEEFNKELNVSATKSRTDKHMEDFEGSLISFSSAFDGESEGIPLTSVEGKNSKFYEMTDIPKSKSSNSDQTGEIKMTNLLPNHSPSKSSFSEFVDEQQKLLELLENGNDEKKDCPIALDTKVRKEDVLERNDNKSKSNDIDGDSPFIVELGNSGEDDNNNENIKDSKVNKVENRVVENQKEEAFVNHAILTLPTKHPSPTNAPNDDHHSNESEGNSKIVPKQYPNKNDSPEKSKRSALTVLLLENLFQRADKFVSGMRLISGNEVGTPSVVFFFLLRWFVEIGGRVVGRGVMRAVCLQIDSAIPFSCITTPEVVASCNTTTSTGQAAVAVDPKVTPFDYHRHRQFRCPYTTPVHAMTVNACAIRLNLCGVLLTPSW